MSMYIHRYLYYILTNPTCLFTYSYVHKICSVNLEMRKCNNFLLFFKEVHLNLKLHVAHNYLHITIT